MNLLAKHIKAFRHAHPDIELRVTVDLRIITFDFFRVDLAGRSTTTLSYSLPQFVAATNTDEEWANLFESFGEML